MKKEKRKYKIGIYCRVSSREAALHGYSIDAQQSKINQFIDLFEVENESIEYYIDEGISAKDTRRPSLKRMLSDIKDKKIDLVYITKLDRLSRSVIDVYKMIEIFVSNDCNIVAIMDNIDINSANGRLFVGILAIIAQWERETVIERTQDGMMEMVAQGKWPYGTRPYGYDKTEDLKLIINEQEADIVKFINRNAIEGKTAKEIENKIFEKYETTISAQRVKEIILKPWYYGVFVYQDKLHFDICPMIYDKEKSLEAQMMIGKRFNQYDDNRYYFRNKIRCTCGCILENKSTKKKSKRYFYYVCPECKERINQDYVVNQTLYAISIQTAKEHTKSNNVKALQKLNALNRKINDLHTKYINDKLDFNIYTMSLYRLEYDKKETIAKIKTEKLIDFMRWAEMSDVERKQFIENHIAKVIVDVIAKIVINISYTEKTSK